MNHKSFAALALASFLTVLPGLRAQGPAFEHAASDLAPEPRAIFGTLPNGLRYVVLPNSEPKGRASLRLLVTVGSLHEREDERGLAHFLEHEAFKGSTHFPPGTLIEQLQRGGMRFGADTNASTYFDRTLYLLEVPRSAPASLDNALSIFYDYACGLLLDPVQIESERGVILSEKRDRDSIAYRTSVAQMGFTYPETLFPKRLPIGDEAVISKVDREHFVGFYDAWYRPEFMTVIAVGDFDGKAVEAAIRSRFLGLRSHGPARPQPDLGTVVSPVGLKVGFHPEREASATSVTLSSVAPYRHETDSSSVRLRHLKRDLAVSMVSRRLDRLSHLADAAFTQGSAEVSEEFNFDRYSAVTLTCKPDDWRRALRAGEQELRRALTYGFTEAELAEAVASFRSDLEQARNGALTRRSDQLADEIAQEVLARKVVLSPAQEAALLMPALATVTAADCLEAFRQAWAGPGRCVFVSGNLELKDAERVITNEVLSSQSVAVKPPGLQSALVWPYTDFGTPGSIASRTEVSDLGVTEVRFANGVRLNVKRTDSEAKRAYVSVRVGAGLLASHEVAKPGLTTLAGQAFLAGGVGKLSADDLKRLFSGTPVAIGFQVEPDAFQFSGKTDPDHLLLELQLLAAQITDPGYRPEALAQVRRAIPEMYARLEHTPEGVFRRSIMRELASGDPRFGVPPRDALEARTLEELKAWLTPEFRSGPIEVAVVGDVDPQSVVAAVGSTFGALPSRAEKGAYASERRVAFPKDPVSREMHVDSKLPQGVVFVVWPAPDGRDVSTVRRMSLLASILSDRMRVTLRNNLSGAYSPHAEYTSTTVYPGYGQLACQVSVDPAAASKILAAVRAIAEDLSKNGVSADEFERAKNPMLASVRDSVRLNGYWMSRVLIDCQEEPYRLEWARSLQKDVGSISKEEVDGLARRYLAPSRAFEYRILPQSASAGPASSSK